MQKADLAEKPCILVASVLKPIHDVRHYHKIGWHLAQQLPEWQFFYAAYGRQTDSQNTYSLYNGGRLSIGRLYVQWRYWRLLWRLRPSAIIITTPELLALSILYRKCSKHDCWLIFDLQENYIANIRYHEGYVFRQMISWLLHRYLQYTLPKTDALLYAEACYADEINAVAQHPKALFISNRVRQHNTIPKPQPFRLVMTGTLSELFGIRQAIHLLERLHAYDSRYHMILTGHVPAGKIFDFLQQAARRLACLELYHVSRQPVDYEHIQTTLSGGGVGLMLYEARPSIARRVPGKLYEYLSYRMPVIGTAHPYWIAVAEQHARGSYFAISTLPTQKDIELLHQWLQQSVRIEPLPLVFFEAEDTQQLKRLASWIQNHHSKKIKATK